MTTKDLLWDQWGVWLSYYLSEQEQKSAEYSDVLKKQHHLTSHLDLIALWALSPLSDLKNFFVCESDDSEKNEWKSYEIDGKFRRINAINFFRNGISPTWEDPKNATGGRLIFQVDKEHGNYLEIYQWLVFYFLGQSYAKGDQINGIRFISPKFSAQLKFHFRVEVWVSFSQEQMEKVQTFRQFFMNSFIEKFSIKTFKPHFKDNKETKN